MRRRRPGHGHDRRAPELNRVDVDERTLQEVRAFNVELERELAASPSAHTVPPAVTRRLRRTGGGGIWGGLVFADHAEEIAVPTRTGQVRGRVLRPGGREPVGLYLHLHGGGWTIGGCDEQDPRLAALAEATGLAVLSIEYRLAPEHPYPAAADDCEDAALWLLDSGLSELGVPARLAIGGESAGAHLSVLTMLRLRDVHGVTGAFAAANLVYGCFDLSQTPSVRRWGDRNLVLSRPIMDWFCDLFLPGMTLEERRDPAVSRARPATSRDSCRRSRC